MIKKMAVAGSGLFLTIGELTINDWYIILLVIALALSILGTAIKLVVWFVNKIKEAKQDDGKVSKAEMKQIAKELKNEFLRGYNEVKSNTQLVEEKIESLKGARTALENTNTVVPIGEDIDK